jgi:hypothetical protein
MRQEGEWVDVSGNVGKNGSASTVRFNIESGKRQEIEFRFSADFIRQ